MLFADVAELADALDLGSSVTDVGVQVPSSAPKFISRINALHHTECSYRTLKFLYVTRFFYCFFSMRIFRYQAIQLLCKFTANKKPLVNKGISPLFRAVFFLIIY